MKVLPQPAATAKNKEAFKAKSKKRLFLRRDSNHLWRKLTPTGILLVLLEYTKCTYVTSSSIHRVKSGLAIVAENDEQRQGFLDAFSESANFSAKIKLSSNKMAFHISNVLVKVNTMQGVELAYVE